MSNLNNKKETIQMDLAELLDSFNNSSVSPDIYYYYKGLKDRTIYITEEISSDLVYTVIMPLIQMDNDGTGEPITIYINTPGGTVYTGMALCNVIENLKTPTTIKVLGIACSMGALILAAGANNPNVTRECTPYSVGLIHSGSEFIEGTSTQVKDKAKFNEKYEAILTKYMVDRLKFTEEEYLSLERYEYWMTAEDMLRVGLVDKINGVI